MDVRSYPEEIPEFILLQVLVCFYDLRSSSTTSAPRAPPLDRRSTRGAEVVEAHSVARRADEDPIVRHKREQLFSSPEEKLDDSPPPLPPVLSPLGSDTSSPSGVSLDQPQSHRTEEQPVSRAQEQDGGWTLVVDRRRRR